MAQFRRLACVIVFYLLVIAVQIVVNKGSTTPDNNGQVQQTKPPNEDDLKDIATSREEPEQTTNEKSSNQLDEASGRDLSPHATVDNQSEDEPQSLSGSVDGSESALPKATVEIGGGEHQPETVSNDDLPQQKHEDIKQEPPSSSDKTQTLKEPPQPAAPKELPPPIPIEPGEASQKPAVIEKKPKSRCFTKGTLYSEILPDGQERCICLDGYYGILCQLRDTCKTIVADQMTGIEICERIGQTCLRSDKIFRCSCAENEYFVFKADHYRVSPAQENQEAGNFGTVNRNVDDEIKQGTQPNLARPSNSPFTHDAMLELVKQEGLAASTLADSKSMDSSGQQQTKQTYYLAECRPVDKCLGVRCRQLSEVCLEGECKCNQNLGYIRDPNDKLCKLLNPCNMPSTDDAGQTMPVCGEARCVPTYDKELFRCVCPIGYYAIQRGPERSSTKCAILSDFICIIPFLNKCQHKCEIDNNLSSYKCSCWPGYRPGSRPGIDDHLCFFEEHLGGMMVHSPYGQPELDDDEFSGSNKRTGRSADNVYGSDQQQQQQQQEQQPLFRRKIVFKQIVDNTTPSGRSADQGTGEKPGKLIQRIVVREQVARRRPIVMNERQHSQFDESQQEQQQQQQVNSLTEENQDDRQLDRELDTSSRRNNNIGDHQYGGDYEEEDSLASMSAQERCNMFCDENKICVLENEAAGSYKCVCDRQGYVSVGDKCMDWCAAVEFNHHLQFLLELTCLTGVCTRQPGNYRRPPSNMASSFYNSFEFRSLPPEERSQLRLEAKSSWRPKFQCDCKNSPLVYEDPISHQCKLNFTAILEPCLPGNPGHTECVINNHAYCSVLHKDPILHKRSHEMEHIITADKNKTIKIESKPVPGSVPPPKSSKKITPPEEEKRYACVCSPEKKLLVDGPRKKARCIKECDLLSNECGRFNRMCRSSTVASNDHFGYDPALVIEDRDGAIRMNQFKRTGCECLPGFSVSPSEARDFTLDTINYSDGDDPSTPSAPPSPTTASSSSSPFANGGGGPVEPNSCCSQKAHRTGWAAIETLQPGSSITLKSPAKLDQNVVPGEIPGVVIQAIEHLKKRYMNINSRCLLDYDVIEFRARFKVPASFEPSWMILNQRANQHPTSQQPPPPASNTSGGLGAEYDDSSSQSPPDGRQATGADQQAAQADDIMPYSVFDDEYNSRILMMPDFMRVNISEFHKHIVLVANCDFLISQKSFQAYEQCIRYRYWIVQKFRAHFADWRQVVTKDLNETFNLMDGNIRFRVNECKPIINRVTSVRRPMSTAAAGASSLAAKTREEILVALGDYDPWDQYARVDADLDCHLTIHSASDYDVSGARRDSQQKVRLEKQMPKFLFYEIVGANTNLQSEQSKKASQTISSSSSNNNINDTTTATPIAITKNIYNAEYFLMAPTTLIHKSTDEHSAANRKDFNPCNNENKYQYCDNQTRCEMVDTVSYSCKCETGYTPIGSRDIRFKDSLKEVCEDIDECLFDVCNADPRYAGKSECFNEIGSFRCRCIGKHIGDNRGYCVPICDLLACKYGVCHIITNNFAYCDCFEGYRDYNCSVQDPSAALRKANTIICCSIFASVLLLTITLAISFRSKLKKTKKELKRLQAAYEAVEFYEFSLQKPPYRHRVSKASIAS